MKVQEARKQIRKAFRKCSRSIFRRNLNMKEKVILAYSGGLDTTAIIG